MIKHSSTLEYPSEHFFEVLINGSQFNVYSHVYSENHKLLRHILFLIIVITPILGITASAFLRPKIHSRGKRITFLSHKITLVKVRAFMDY